MTHSFCAPMYDRHRLPIGVAARFHSPPPPPPQPTTGLCQGIETIRRDSCPAVSKLLEQSLRMLFSGRDLTAVKAYLRRQWTKILANRVSVKDFIFAKEVRWVQVEVEVEVDWGRGRVKTRVTSG